MFRVYDERRVSGDAPEETRVRVRPSPMDKALDAGRENRGAPGLLESLVACTAPPERARAHGGARGAASRGGGRRRRHRQGARALAYSVTVDSSVDATLGRVRALEWLNALVVARLRVLSNVAADVAEARERESRRLASVARDGVRPNRVDGGLREAASRLVGGAVAFPRGGPVPGRRRRGGRDAVRGRRALRARAWPLSRGASMTASRPRCASRRFARAMTRGRRRHARAED